MKERGIIMQAESIKGILAGRKSMTRRVIKPQPHAGVRESVFVKSGLEDGHGNEISCPYGKPGDLLYVKEVFTILDYWDADKVVQVMYEDGTTSLVTLTPSEFLKFSNWKEKTERKSSLFMFKSLSRIWLENTGTSAERVQDISEEDAIAEGIKPVVSYDIDEEISRKQMYENYLPQFQFQYGAIKSRLRTGTYVSPYIKVKYDVPIFEHKPTDNWWAEKIISFKILKK